MKVLVTGAGGGLGTDLVATFSAVAHHEVIAADHAHLDVGDRDQVLGICGQLQPDLIVHAAAWTAVDACESDRDRAWRINALGSRYVAEGARLAGAHLVAVSTDYVFDGEADRPYTEWDATAPRSVYGASKRAGELEVLTLVPDATVVRTSWVGGRHGSNMVKTLLRLAAGTGPLRFVDDQRGSPSFTDDLAAMIYRLGVGRRPGLHHVTNQGVTTWYGLACEVLALAGADPARVEPVRAEELTPPRPAPRPANSVLDNAALRLGGIDLLADYHEPLERTVAALRA